MALLAIILLSIAFYLPTLINRNAWDDDGPSNGQGIRFVVDIFAIVRDIAMTIYKIVAALLGDGNNSEGSYQGYEPRDIKDVAQHAEKYDHLILNQRIVIFLLLNAIGVIVFKCYATVISPSITLVETRFIVINTLKIGGPSALLFGTIFYAIKSISTLNKEFRKLNKRAAKTRSEEHTSELQSQR